MKILNFIRNWANRIGFSDGVKPRGRFELQCHDKDGNLKWSVKRNNLIVSTGKAALAGLAGNTGGLTAFTYLALGTSSASVTVGQTALQAEQVGSGLDRAAATVSRTTTNVTNDTTTLAHTWSVTGSVSIQEIGIFNAASTGIMLGRALTGSKSVVNTDTVTGTYNVTFS